MSDEQADEIIDYENLKQCVVIYKQEKFVCEEGIKVQEWYEGQRAKFLEIKAKVDRYKLEGGSIEFEYVDDLREAMP